MKDFLKQEFDRDVSKIYFIGIGGTSMSGLANLAMAQGFEAEGSDNNPDSVYVKILNKQGVKTHSKHDAANIGEDVDLVVFSSAISPDNPEMLRAKELGIPTVERSDYLGMLSKTFETTIGVAGTHGKTTTSSMIAQILHRAGLDPSVSIGGRLDEIDGNAHLGKSDYFVIESCEFKDSFLKTQHQIGVITNIEEDHEDYFKGGIRQILQSFHRFGMIIPKNGLMVAWGDQDLVHEACEGLKCPVVYYGFNEDNDWSARNAVYDGKAGVIEGLPTFDVYKGDEKYGTFRLEVGGEHNVLNALAAIIVADYLGVSKEKIQEALSDFTGAHRRFEFRGRVNGINVFEDYAHHPTELNGAITTASKYDHNNLWVVFQPHTYSRTKYRFDGFVDAFDKADKIILNDIYSDREENEWNIYSEDLAKCIKEKHNYQKPTIVMTSFDSIVKFLLDNVAPRDMVLVAGSQTINKVAYMFFDELKKKFPDSEIIEPEESA